MFFYEPLSATAIASVLVYLAFLIGMNELSRLNKWFGAAIFIALPLVLTIFVWPHTAVEGTGAGTWFQWVKTYSCLAGAILGWLIVYFPAFQKKYIVCIPPIIFAINILEACITCTKSAGRCASRPLSWPLTLSRPWCATFRCSAMACGTAPLLTTYG